MKLRLTSIMVQDQAHALDFYTRVLGFVKKTDIDMQGYRWLTIVPAQQQEGLELLLEPIAFEPAKVYQKALYDAGIPAALFDVENIQQEYERLQLAGVVFSMQPQQMGAVSLAVFDDTCGNYIQLAQG